MTLLLIFLIIFIVWPLVSAMWKIGRQIYRVRAMMKDPAEFIRQQAEQQQRYQQQADNNPHNKHHQNRGKKIASDVGEYVDFTEIKGTSKTNNTERKTEYFESQISDIEWEDVK